MSGVFTRSDRFSPKRTERYAEYPFAIHSGTREVGAADAIPAHFHEEIELIEENHWRVVGSMSVLEASEEIGVTLRGEEDTFDTIGGFVIARLAYIPQDGETPEFTYQNLTVKVLTVKEKRIEAVEITKKELPEDSEEALAAAK